jgi:hypothetical protein
MFLIKKITFPKKLLNNVKINKIIFLIFILYLFLRLLPIILNDKHLFIDEIYSIEKIEYSWYQNFVQATPVHYLISKFFLVFFSLKIYSLILPYIIISLLLFIILIKNKFFVARKDNILFFLLFTISLPAIYYSSFIGHYGPFLLFSVLSHIYLIKSFKNKLRHIIKFFLFSFLTTLSHHVGIFFFIINIVFLGFYKRKIIIFAIIILCIIIFTALYLSIFDTVKEIISPHEFKNYEINTLKGTILYLFKHYFAFSNGNINLSYSLERVLADYNQNNYFIYNYFFFFKAVINFYLFGQTSVLSTIYFIIFLIGFVSAAIKFLNNKRKKRGGVEVSINSNYCLFLIIFTFIFFYIFRFRHTFDEKYLIYLSIPVLFFFTEGIIIFLERCKKIFKFEQEISFFLVVFIFLSNLELYLKVNSRVYIEAKHVYNFPKALARIENDSLVIVRDMDYNEFSLNKKIFNYKFLILAEDGFIKNKKINLEKIYWLSIPDIETMKLYPHVNVIKHNKAGNVNIYEIKRKN